MALRRVDRAQIRIVHRERPIHLCAEALRHLNRFLDLDERIVHPAFAEIQLAQSAAGLKIVRLGRQELFNLSDFFVGRSAADRRDRPMVSFASVLQSVVFVHTIPCVDRLR